MEECTFKPNIINKFAKNSCSSRNNQLYQNHIIRVSKVSKKQGNRKQEEMYQPKINKISKGIVTKNFYQRLEEDAHKRELKKKSLEKQQRNRSHERKPSIGRAPTNRDLGTKTVGEYLYQKSRESRALTVKEQPQICTDSRSQKIYAQSKRLAFQYIF